MKDRQQNKEQRADEASAESFPASDPPAHTPVAGPGGHDHSEHEDPRRILKDEAEARKRDPHGTGPAEAADNGEPAARPTSERHDTETTIGRVTGQQRQDGPGRGS